MNFDDFTPLMFEAFISFLRKQKRFQYSSLRNAKAVLQSVIKLAKKQLYHNSIYYIDFQLPQHKQIKKN